jgi:hypothetical protein
MRVLWAVLGCGSAEVSPPAVPPPAPVDAPTGPIESLGGVVQDAPFDPSGFSCEPGRCEKPAELAGVTGKLIVWTCGDKAHRIGFREEFLFPETVADQLHRPSQGDVVPWTTAIRDALRGAGFTGEWLEGEALAEFRRLSGPPELNALGEPFPPPEGLFLTNPDGRERTIHVKQVGASAEATHINPIAWKMEVTLSTVAKGPCTAGI